MAEKKVPYQVNGRKFEGMIVYDESVKAKRPAIFMQPDWKGVCADTIAQARTVAGKDYVVLMADMFGAGYGDKPKTQQELAAGMRAVHNDLAFTIACGGKGLRHAACRGEQARPRRSHKESGDRLLRGRRLRARTGARRRRFQGAWSCSTSPIPIRSSPARPATSRAGCWRIHGSADPMTPKPMMDALEEELTKAKVDWQSMMFGGAVHSFCDPTANAGPTRYDEKLCRKSYMLMRDFFAETL